MPIQGYATRVDAGKTVGQIMALLAKHGARAVHAVYEGEGLPAALSFIIATSWGETEFRLPIRVAGVHAYLQRERDAGRIDRDRYATRDHAINVAWRLCLEWLQVQLSLVETEMVALDEIMLPFALVGEQRISLHEAMVTHGMRLLLPQGGG